MTVFWAALVLPSLYVVHKYLGMAGAVAYAAAVPAALAVASRVRILPANRSAKWYAVATFAAVVIAFALVYPRVNVHVPGAGSDDDDAYNVGAWALVSGQSPYEQTTYLGNALHQLPGAFIVAMPFVLAGTSALQNLFWIPLFFVTVGIEARSARTALRFAWTVLALAPVVMHEVVTGTGHIANTVYVLLGLWWLTRTKHPDLASVAWGITLASRANFFFLVPLAFAWMRHERGTGAAIRSTALTCAAGAALTLPWYFHDPARFGPLDAADRVMRFNGQLPYAGEAILALMGVVAVALSLARMDRAALFRNCAIVQMVPVAAVVMLGVVLKGRVDLALLAYATFASWFALMGLVASDARRVPLLLDEVPYQHGDRVFQSG